MRAAPRGVVRRTRLAPALLWAGLAGCLSPSLAATWDEAHLRSGLATGEPALCPAGSALATGPHRPSIAALPEPEPEADPAGGLVAAWCHDTDDPERSPVFAYFLRYEDGSPAFAVRLHDGRAHGEAIGWNRDGQQIATLAYEAGVPHGLTTIRGTDGALLVELPFERGELHGLVRLFFDGLRDSEMTYVHGVATGPARYWHARGSLEREGQLLDGNLHGEWRSWTTTGELESVCRYHAGELLGCPLPATEAPASND